MNQQLFKNDIVDKISERLRNDRIVIGGNKIAYKRKYHLRYGEKIIRKVLDAFLDVIVDTIENGDSLRIYDYFRIDPHYFKEMSLKANGFSAVNEDDNIYVPPRYKVKFKPGKRLKEACKKLSEREI